jgi:hypothetical protein
MFGLKLVVLTTCAKGSQLAARPEADKQHSGFQAGRNLAADADDLTRYCQVPQVDQMTNCQPQRWLLPLTTTAKDCLQGSMATRDRGQGC